MPWFRKAPPEVFDTSAFTSMEEARRLILARLKHRAGPAWNDRYGDPLSWLEQVYYDLEDEQSRAHFTAAVITLCEEPGVRWAALTLARMLRLGAAIPALLRIAASGALREQAEGPCADLQVWLIVTLEELGSVEAVPLLQTLLEDPIYAVSACLALLRIAPERAIPGLPSVAAASSQAADGSSGLMGTIGAVLAAPLRSHDADTFLKMVRALQECDRPTRLHAAEALRRQSELEDQPDLEAEARRMLLRDLRAQR